MAELPDGVEDAKKGRRAGAGGPRSRKGKDAVRLNPLKHGVLAQTPVIPLVERWEDWERLRAGMMAYWEPDGMMEEVLSERLAVLAWRMARAVRFESESIGSYLGDVPRDWREAREAAGLPVPREVTPQVVAEMNRMLTARLLPDDGSLEKVMRYEARLHRFFLQTMHQLMVLQGLRRGPGSQNGFPDLQIPGDPVNARRKPMMNRLMPGGRRFQGRKEPKGDRNGSVPEEGGGPAGF